MIDPWKQPPARLVGKRVELVPLELEHVPGLLKSALDPEIWKFVPYRVMTEPDMRRYVEQACSDRDRGDSLPFTIRAAESGTILGCSRYYSMAKTNRNLEIGYTWLNRSVWRSAVNSECKFLLLKYAFEEMQCIRVALRTDMRNTRSQAAIERLGAVKEGVLRNHMLLPDGYRRDTVYYSIIDTEWPAVKERLMKGLNRSE